MLFLGNSTWEEDNAVMTAILEEIEFYSGSESTKLKMNCGARDSGRMLYGYTWKGYLKKDKDTGENIMRTPSPYKGLYNTKIVDLYPELIDIFYEFGEKWFGDFEFDSIQMTKNFEIMPHKDTKNIGESVICGFGYYTGGELVIKDIWNKLVNEYDYAHNIQEKPVKFNGYEKYHYVMPFEGTRYSLVFFNQHKSLVPRPRGSVPTI